MSRHYDAIIVGAGPAGSTAAILLAQAGWSVALIEKDSFPRRKVCGECIAASNLPLLDRLGVGEAFHRLAGAELKQFALMSGKHVTLAPLPPLQNHRYAWGKALGREQLDTLLLEHARNSGATVLQPCRVLSVHGIPGDFTCMISPFHLGEALELRSSLVIGAYGSWESPPVGRPYRNFLKMPGDLFGFKANYRNSSLAPGLLPVIAFAGGYGGMVLESNGIATLACCISRATLRQCRQQYGNAPAGEAVEAYLKASCTGMMEVLASATREGNWLSIGPIRPGIRVCRPNDYVLPIGNAAGEAHPIIGEGISIAMQSSCLLADILSGFDRHKLDSRTWELIRTRYAEQWVSHFSGRIRLSSLFAHAAMHPALTWACLPFIKRWPGIITYGARLSGKVRLAPVLHPEILQGANK